MNPIASVLNSDLSLLVVLPLALLLLTTIIFVHELGHFYIAHRCGVYIKEFAIGFPPRLWSTTRGGMTCTAQPITSIKHTIRGDLRVISQKSDAPSVSGGIVVLDSTISNLNETVIQVKAAQAIGLIIIGRLENEQKQCIQDHLLPTVTVARADGDHFLSNSSGNDSTVQIETRPDALGRKTTRIQINATRFSINAIPIGGYVRMSGENSEFAAPNSFTSRPAIQRAAILLSGPLMNLLLVPLLFIIASLIADVTGSVVTNVSAGTPAEHAGILEGDRLVHIGENRIRSVSDVQNAVHRYGDQEITLSVERAGKILFFTTTPRANPPPGEGALGVQIAPTIGPAPIEIALGRAPTRTLQALLLLPLAIGQALSGSANIELAGPVGIVHTVGEAARQGPEVVFVLAAFLTAQIGLLNLAPWPGLDGGRLVFVGIELLTGHRIPPKREAALHFAGILVLLTLAIAITIGDVQRVAGL